MKIWIDAQLPPAITEWINHYFEVDSSALRDLGLRDAKDREIFCAAEAAALGGYSSRAWAIFS